MTSVLFLSFAAIVLSIIIGNKLKVNIGVVAGIFAVLIGIIGLGMRANDFFMLMPNKIIFTVTVITLFYGFLSENGTLTAVINHMVYSLHENCVFIPPAIFLTSAIVSAIGIGAPTATAILAPIVMTIAPRIKQKSILLGASVSYGVCIGGNFILSQGGIISSAIIDSTAEYAGMGRSIMFRAFILSMVFYAAVYFVIFLLNSKLKQQVNIDTEKPEPFTDVQKKSLVVLAAMLFMILASALLSHLLPKGALKTFFTQFDFSFIVLIGIFVESVMKLADFPVVSKKHVPVSTLVFFTGMTMLMGVAIKAGIVQWLSAIVENSVPRILVGFMLTFVAGIMSCFSSSLSVVIPVMFPLVPPLAASLGLPASLLYSGIFIGATCAGISPFSTGGFLLVSSCQVREEYHGLWNYFLRLCIINILSSSLLILVLSLFPFFK